MIRFPNGAAMWWDAHSILHRFADGVTNLMHRRDVDDAEHAGYAAWAGFAETWPYMVAHDLTHHVVAEASGWPHSRALHDPEDVPLSDASPEVQSEEHLTNHLLRKAVTRDADPYGQVQKLFPDDQAAAERLRIMLEEHLLLAEGRAVL